MQKFHRKYPYKAILIGLFSLQLYGCTPIVLGTAIVTGAKVANDRRDVGTQINDQTIELRLQNRLNEHPATRTNHIVVVSDNYNVLLAGEAYNQNTIDVAEQLARSEPGVKKVWNQLKVMPNSGILQRSNDTLTTGRVKAGMVQIDMPGFDPTRINVTTVNGIVYLMGIVTAEEAEITKRFARTVSGVQGVVALYEINPSATSLRN